MTSARADAPAVERDKSRFMYCAALLLVEEREKAAANVGEMRIPRSSGMHAATQLALANGVDRAFQGPDPRLGQVFVAPPDVEGCAYVSKAIDEARRSVKSLIPPERLRAMQK